MDISPRTLHDFYRVGWERRWISRLDERLVPGDAGFKFRLFETIKLLGFSRDESFAVLDLGCGVGIYGIQILREFRNARIWGMDLSAEHIAAARELARKAGLSERANFWVADVTDFWVDIKPEVILATEILEHLPDPRPALENIKRLSTGKTRIIISVPNKLHETGNDWVFYRQLTGENFNNIQTDRLEELDGGKPRYTFYHKEYEPQEIQHLLTDSGFRINRIRFCFFQYPVDAKTGAVKKWFIQKLNYTNRRITCSFLDYWLRRLLGNKHCETIILDCTVETHAQKEGQDTIFA
jgi:2-polyprenyl-3-methyl-5-hydroxy-6-metoxy-1,4-benzoquinol methylase